jgi:hypothetical protein
MQVSFPEVIDMKPFMGRPDTISEDTPKQLYRLSGVLLHKGASAYHGHYETEIDVGYDKDLSFEASLTRVATLETLHGCRSMTRRSQTSKTLLVSGRRATRHRERSAVN